MSATQDGEAPDVGISYAEANRLGFIDQDTGLITIPSLGTSMTISEAIDRGIIDPEKEAITDSKTGKKYTLQDCFKTNKINPNTGKIENEKDRTQLQDLAVEEDKKSLNLLDAVALGYFDPEKCLFHDKKGQTFTLEEAIKNNVINIDFISVENLSTHEKIPFEKALKMGLVDKQTAEVTDTKTLKKLPLKTAIDRHIVESMYEPQSGNIFDLKTQQMLPVDTVIQKGLDSGSQMEFYDSKKNENVPLSEAIQRGLVDQKSGKIIDSKSGKKLDAKEAVKIGLLAVVGAPIIGPVLAGKAVCDAVKKKLNEKSKPPQKPDVPPKPAPKEKQPISTAAQKEKQPISTAAQKEKQPSSKTAAKEKEPSSMTEAKEKQPSSMTAAKEKEPSSTVEAKEKQPSSMAEAKKKEPSSTAEAKEKKPSPVEAAKGKEPSSAAAAKGKEPSSAAAAKGKEPSSAEAAKGKEPSSVEAAKGKQPSSVEAAKGKEPSSVEAAKGKQPSSVEAAKGKEPSSVEAAKGKEPSSVEAAKEEQPSSTAAAKEKQPSSTAAAKEKLPSSTAAPKEKQPSSTAAPKEKQPSTMAAPKEATPAEKTKEGPPVPQKPTTTIIYAKADDKIKPSQPDSIITSESQSLIKTTSIESKVGDSPSSDSGISSAQDSILGKPVSYPSVSSSDSPLTQPEDNSRVTPSVSLKDGSNVVIDWEKGLVTDSKTGTQMTVTEAVQKGLLNTDLVENLAEQIVPQSTISRDVKVDWEKGQVTHKKTGESLSVTEALHQGLITTSTAHSLATVSGEQLPSAVIRAALEEKKTVSSRKELIETNGREKLITSPSESAMTLNDAVHGGHFVAETSKIIDPQTGKAMSVREAIRSGVIDGESSVIIDPKSGNALSVNQAICEKVVDPQTGELIHTQTKERIPLNEALLEGLIPDDTTTSGISVVTDEFDSSQTIIPSNGAKKALSNVTKCYSLKEAIDQRLIDEQSGTFTDPVTKDVMSLAAAIQFGLIDSSGEEFKPGSFQYPQDSSDIQKTKISSAAQPSAVSQQADLTTDKKTTVTTTPEETKIETEFDQYTISKKPAVVSKTVTQSKESIVSEMTISEVKNGDYSPIEKISDVKVVKRKSKDKGPDETSKRLSFAEALDQGFIDLAANQYTDPKTGSRMAILDAIREQLIDPTTEAEITPEPSVEKSLSLTTAIDAGLFDQSTCKFTEPMTGQQLSLEEAVDRGFINGQTAIYDLKDQKMLTLQDAWEEGKIDKTSGKFIEGGKKHSLKDAAKMGLIAVAGIAGAPLIAGGLLVDKARKTLRKQTSPISSTAPVAIEVTKSSIVQPNVIEVVKVKQITPVNEEAMTFMEAISSGFLNPKTGMYKIPSSGNSIPLKEAIESGYIYPTSGFITIAGQSYSLQEAIAQGLLNDKGQLVDPKTKSKRTLDDLIKSGDIQEALVDSHSSSKITIKVTDKLSIDEVLDPATGKFIDLDSALKKGIVDVKKGIYCNPITGQTFSLSEALNSDFIHGSMLDSLVSREEKTREGYKAAISFSEQKDICISSVTDPMSGEKMPLSEAVQKEILNVKQETFINQKTGETLSLDEALNKGYISAEESDVKHRKTKPSGATDEVTVTKRHSISISHVTDPQTHTVMPISDAVEEGLVDLSEGVIRNRKTGEQIPLAEAFKKGMVKGSEVISEPDSCPKDDLASSGSRETLQVQSVFDPASGQFVSVEDAMKKGIINLETGTFTNKNGEKMSISEAVKKGLCQSQKVSTQPKADGSELLPIKFVVDSQTGRSLTVTEAIEQGIVDKDLSHYFSKKTGETFSISKAIEKDLVKTIKPAADSIVSTQEQETIRVTEVVDGRTGKTLSLDKAIKAGIFDPRKGEVIDITTGEHLPVQKAVTKGLVKVASTSPTDPSTEKPVFSISAVKDAKTGKKLSAEEAIKAGILDTDKNLFTDTLTGETISLADAIKKNLVFEAKKTKKCDIQKGISRHVNISSVLDTITGKELTLEEAIQKNIIDNENKTYTDAASNKVYNLEYAMKEGFISGSVQSVVTTKTTVSSQKPGVTYNVTGAIDPEAEQMISMADAFEKGILDPAGNYVDIKSNTTFSITEAIQKGLVQAEIVENENIKSAKPAMTFKDALVKGLIDCKTGVFNDQASTNSYSVDEAILLGILSDENGEPFKFIEGPSSPRTYSFQESIMTGLIDPTSGMFTEPKKKATCTIQEAINQKYLSPKLSRSKKSKKESVMVLKGSQARSDTKPVPGMTFKQALDEGFLDMKAKRYHDPEKGVDISVEEAVKRGLLGDLTSGELMTFEDASKCSLIDSKTGTFTNPVTNESISLDEAFQCGFLVPTHDDLPTKDDKLPTNEDKPISLSEALQKGNLDANTWTYTDPTSHITMPLDKALQLGYIEAKVDAKPSKPRKEKVAPQDQYVTVTEGSPFSPEESSHYVNGELLSKSATEIQTLATSSTYVTSPGFYIDSAGKVVNKVTGDVMPLKDAIAAGLVSSEAVEGSSSLQVIGGQTPPALEADVTDSVSKCSFSFFFPFSYSFFFFFFFFFAPSASFSFCVT